MDFNALRQKTLASTLTPTAQYGATAFGLHACTEAELAFARALRGLIGALHVLKIFLESGRRECTQEGMVSMDDLAMAHFR